MSDDHQRDNQQATDPWGLPIEGDAQPTWPEDVSSDHPETDTPPTEDAVPEEEEEEEEGTSEEPSETVPRPEEVATAKDALQQVVDSPADPEPSTPAETPEVETAEQGSESPPGETRGSPFEGSPGPLSQALAAAKNVISSLQEPSEETTQAAPEEAATQEDLPEEPAAEEAVAEEPAREDLPEGPAGEEDLAEEPAAEEAVAEEPAQEDLPEEPPPWLEEDESAPRAPEDTVVVEESTVQEVTVEFSEGVEQVLEDVVALDLDDEDHPGAELAHDVTEADLELLDEEETVEETVVIEVDEETSEEDLERLAAELAGYAEEGDEVVVEEAEIRLERAIEEPEEEPVDTTPSAYSELASMDGGQEGTVPAAHDEPSVPEVEEPPAETGGATEEPADAEEPSPEPTLAEQRPAETVQAEAPSVEWGALWKESAQGWVEDEEGNPTWRPIVTTTPTLADWEVDTYLGVVGGETMVGAPGQSGATRGFAGSGRGSHQQELARARAAAVRAMVDDAVARGAHAVIGVEVGYAPVGGQVLVTASGTAVTLKTRS